MSFFLFELFLINPGYSQEVKSKKRKEKKAAIENALLWKIEENGIQTSYLFGTLHILSKSDFNLSEKTLEAFKTADQIVMELDMDNPGMQMEIMQHVDMKDGTTLDQLLSEEDYQKLDKAFQASYGTGVQYFNKWKPFMASALLMKNYIDGESASYEGTFVELAKEQNKELLGLETPEEQLSVFDQIPYAVQAKDLAEMLNNEEKTRKMYASMIELYKAQDLKGLSDLMNTYYKDAKQMELLLDSRNESWIPKIGEFAKDKGTFFAVGAGHLPGKMGVVELLKKEGYTLTPIY